MSTRDPSWTCLHTVCYIDCDDYYADVLPDDVVDHSSPGQEPLSARKPIGISVNARNPSWTYRDRPFSKSLERQYRQPQINGDGSNNVGHLLPCLPLRRVLHVCMCASSAVVILSKKIYPQSGVAVKKGPDPRRWDEKCFPLLLPCK